MKTRNLSQGFKISDEKCKLRSYIRRHYFKLTRKCIGGKKIPGKTYRYIKAIKMAK